MSKKTRIAIGVPFYGPQEALWWLPLVQKVGLFPKMGLEFAGIFTAGSSSTDKNRNMIVEDFRNHSEADWIYWMDSDNVAKNGTISRLLKMGKTIASGLYYGKGKGHSPIAYAKKDGAYVTIDKVLTWERGEILPVDAVGMGACLIHRSVYDDIEAKFTPFQMGSGGVRLVENAKIKNAPKERKSYKNDGMLIDGQYRERMFPVEYADYSFPFYMSEYGRTEDMPFFEYAKIAGHGIYLDTSLEIGHVKAYEVTGRHFRETQRRDTMEMQRRDDEGS